MDKHDNNKPQNYPPLIQEIIDTEVEIDKFWQDMGVGSNVLYLRRYTSRYAEIAALHKRKQELVMAANRIWGSSGKGKDNGNLA